MKYLFQIFAIIAIILLAKPVLSIGVTPPRIIVENALKETSIEQSIKLTDVNQGDNVKITLSGEGSEWITVKEGSEFIVSNQDAEDISFILEVPEKAPNGDYKVLAQIVTSPSSQKTEGKNTASVITGIMAELIFTVTGDEIKKYSIRRIDVPNIEVGMPLTVVATIKNEGNVIAKPSRVEIDVKEKENREIIFSGSSQFENGVDPFMVGESVAFLNVNLPEDLYFADIKIFDEGKTHTEEDLPFDILAVGALASSGELIEVFVQENVGDLAKITAVFENTGKIGLQAILTVEVYYNSRLLDIIESEPKYVAKEQSQEFTLQYSPNKKGEYTLKSYVVFSNKKTPVKEITFKANPKTNILSLSDHSIVSISLVVLLLISIIFIITKARNNKKENELW